MLRVRFLGSYFIVLSAAVLTAIGLAVGFFIFPSVSAAQYHDVILKEAAAQAKPFKNEARKVLFCPMHPHIISHVADSCPICGMELVERTGQVEAQTVDADEPAPVVSVSANMQQILGVKLVEVSRGRLNRSIISFGEVVFDEETINHVHSRVSGWIENLYAKSQGEVIKAGDRLYDIYSPQLHSAQKDYLLMLANGRKDMQQSAANRLHYLGLSAEAIAELKRTGLAKEVVPFYAKNEGIVSQLNIRQGMYVEPGVNILSISQLDAVWIIAEVPAVQVSWLRRGLAVDLHYPGHAHGDRRGEIDYIYPELDPITRNVQLRIRFNNHDGLLRPGSIVDVGINAIETDATLLIPSDALIKTGQRDYVVKQLSSDEFLVVDVQIGAMHSGQVQILFGLNEADLVVTRGQFLIDSESQLQQALNRFIQKKMQTDTPLASKHQSGS